VPASVLAKIGGGFALATLAAAFVPRLDESGETPALSTMFLTAVCVAGLTTAALYLALTRDLALPRLIVAYVVAYNGLVVFVKFVLSPEALYEHSEHGTLDALLFDPNDAVGATVVAATVFTLYAAALFVIYRLCRRKLEGTPAPSLGGKRMLVGAALVAAVVFASGGIALLLAFGGLEYVGFVFSSSVSLLVALSLAGAASLAGIAFRDTAVRSGAVGDAALLVSVFWVALVFLALYHVLWVVYILVLTTIWPLKVITPK
jgi:hypothetical protein